MSVQVGIVTALTVVSGVAILTVYIFLLKMNGWIGQNSYESKPLVNHEKKPQQKLVEIRDFSIKKENETIAKPETSSRSQVDKKPPELETVNSKIELESQKVTPKIPGIRPTQINGLCKENRIDKATLSANKPKEIANLQTTNNPAEIKQKAVNIERKKPIGCKNYLGYLCIYPKKTPLPDECFACSRLIDCPKADIKLKENNNSQTTDQARTIEHETIKVAREKPEGCENFLGYLKVHPKSKQLPDKCLTCNRLINCLNKIEK